MRKIEGDKLSSLQKEGVKIFTDGQRYLHHNKPSQPQPLNAAQQSEAIKKLSALADEQRVISGQLAEYGKVVARCIEEVSKPKMKKRWICSVSRGVDGKIDNINVQEQ